jgi:chemotaxis signal transduction protein
VHYLTFVLADQLCGIELSSIRQWLGYIPFSPLVGEHPSIVGVFDLRGQRTRVIDLRTRFGLPTPRTDDTTMLLVESNGSQTALIVDKAIGLQQPTQIAPISSISRSRIDPSVITGIATAGKQTLNILDLSRTLVIPPSLPKAA